MSSTKVEICNFALMDIGQRSIQSLEEASREANLCKLTYDRCRKEVLRIHPWRFAVTKVLLALKDVEDSEYSFVYALPSDCLRVLLVVPNSDPDNPVEYEVVGDELRTDEEAAELKYIRDVTDPGQFDDSFVDVLAHRIATTIAMPLTGKSDLQGNCLKLFLNSLPTAQSVSSSESRKPTPGVSAGSIAKSRA
jgi:hypothetical protein